MSTEFDALKASYETFKGEVKTDVADLLAKVKGLQDQLNGPSPDAAALKSLAAEIVQDTTDLHASVSPAPAPTPPPA